MYNKEYDLIFALYNYENSTNEEKEKWLKVINVLKEENKDEEE